MNKQTLPPIEMNAPPVDILQYFYQFRREWDQVMHMNQIFGADSRFIAHLLQSQFNFLEQMIMDLTGQIRALREQFTSEQLERHRNSQKSTNLQTESTALVQKIKSEIESQKALIKKYDQEIKLVGEKYKSLMDVIKQQEMRIQEINLIQSQNERAMNQNIEETTQKFERRVENIGLQNQEKVVAFEQALSTQVMSQKTEQDLFNQSVFDFHQSFTSRLDANEKRVNSRLDDISTKLELLLNANESSKQERRQFVTVLAAMKDRITKIRSEHTLFGHDIEAKIDSNIKSLKKQLRAVSRPLIIT